MQPLPESNNLIDWSLLAEPQADQYDTGVILHLASSTTSAARPKPYQRTPVGDSPSVFDGNVAVRHVYRSLPEFASLSDYPDAPLDHPNIQAAVEYVRRWPRIFRQCQYLLEAIHPACLPGMPLEAAEIYRGSLCHSYEQLFGTMWATIFCPIGLAEAIVHEVAHQKLRVLGVSFEAATTVVGNDPSDLFISPIIKDRLRPLTAVLHAEYSYVHVTALNINVLAEESDRMRRIALSGVLKTNLSRIEEGYETLRKHFQPGEHGREFMDGFSRWTERTIESGRDLLARAARTAFSQSASTSVIPGPPRLTHLLNAREPVVFAYNGGIGDRLCNLPALRALNTLFGDRLALICGKGDRELYYSDLNLRAVHELDFELIDGGFGFEAAALAPNVTSDLFLSINPWHTSSVSELLAKFPNTETIGFFPEFGHQLVCDYDGHAMDMAFAVPQYLNSALKLSDFSQPPAISGPACAIADDFRRQYAGWKRVLFVHPETKTEKSWLSDRFERVLRSFLNEFPEFIALVVDSLHQGILWRQLPDRVLPVTLPLDACFALLRDSELFLGVDSCHLHAANLFRVPGVALFGPTSSRRWGYKFCNHRHVQSRGEMHDIQVNEVFEALSSLARLSTRQMDH